jgi:hypothetical protein
LTANTATTARAIHTKDQATIKRIFSQLNQVFAVVDVVGTSGIALSSVT